MKTAADMAALHAQAFPNRRMWTEDEFAAFHDDPNSHIVTTDYGFAILRVITDEAEIVTIAIDPRMQGKGWGRHLLAKVVTHAQSAGANSIFLEVAENNSVAGALYNSAGFSQVGRRVGYYKDLDDNRCDALVLRRNLSTVDATTNSKP